MKYVFEIHSSVFNAMDEDKRQEHIKSWRRDIRKQLKLKKFLIVLCPTHGSNELRIHTLP